MHPLTGENIREHLLHAQQVEKATWSHFRSHSPLFKALYEHVRTASEKTCIVEREGREVSCHRGTGYAVEIQDPILHFALPGETEVLSFQLRVGYCPLEDDAEYDSQGGRDVERVYRLYCPIDLELNFTKEKFDLWIKEMREKQDAELLKKERKVLDRLLKRHPKYATEKLLKMRPSAS